MCPSYLLPENFLETVGTLVNRFFIPLHTGALPGTHHLLIRTFLPLKDLYDIFDEWFQIVDERGFIDDEGSFSKGP